MPAERVATALAGRTRACLLWCDGGRAPGCDAQYLFANDILGYTDGHVPRTTRRLSRLRRPNMRRLQQERVAAYPGVRRRCGERGAYPRDRHLVRMGRPAEQREIPRVALDQV